MICKCGNSINVPSYLENSIKINWQCDKCFNTNLRKADAKIPDSSVFKTCAECGSEFLVDTREVKNKIYCSKICRMKAAGKAREGKDRFAIRKVCPNCKKEFSALLRYEDQVYCSKKCSAAVYGKVRMVV